MGNTKWLFLMSLISLVGVLVGFFWFGIRPVRSKQVFMGEDTPRKKYYLTIVVLNLILLLATMLVFYLSKKK
jgi:hypothetical protein